MCVVTESGIEAIDAYGYRIRYHGGTERHRSALRLLLSAEPVTVSDSEIAHFVDADGSTTLSIRFPRDRYRTRLVVRPLTAAEVATWCPNETRRVPPQLRDWLHVGAGRVAWRLYACAIVAMFSDIAA